MRAFAVVLLLTSIAGAIVRAQAPAAPITLPLSSTPAASMPVQVRVKDVARVQSARDNQLLGYGLVVGLNGTGDSTQSTFTALTISNMLKRLNITLPAGTLQTKNVAAVMVTADIPPFQKSGDRLDVTVSSLGDAGSLQGGTLLQTPLLGADNNVYAVAQGSISLGGYTANGGGGSSKILRASDRRAYPGRGVSRGGDSHSTCCEQYAGVLTAHS